MKHILKKLTMLGAAFGLLFALTTVASPVVKAGMDCNDEVPHSTDVITEYSLPSGVCPLTLVNGTDTLYFISEQRAVGKIADDGTATMFDLDIPLDHECGVADSNDNLWVSIEVDGEAGIAKITPGGTVTAYDLPQNGYSPIRSCALGSDGNIWAVVDTSGGNEENNILKITLDGSMTVYDSPSYGGGPTNSITAGPGGKLYLLYGDDDYYLASITVDGEVNTHSISFSEDTELLELLSDGTHLFVMGAEEQDESFTSFIDKLSLTGERASFYRSAENQYIVAAAIEPDNTIWFGGAIFDMAVPSMEAIVGRISHSGTSATLYKPVNAEQVMMIPSLTYHAGNIWFPIYQTNKVAKIAASTGSDTPNQTTLQNPETNQPILLETPEGTELTCSNTTKESSLSKQDSSYQYPLGLVEFCFDTENQNNEVSLTFVTDLKPNQVKARKYNSTNNTYFNIEGATITETALEGQAALKLTYTITDNGQLDLDPITGQIKDPVGLAVTADELAGTGENQQLFQILAVTLLIIVGPGLYLRRRSA